MNLAHKDYIAYALVALSVFALSLFASPASAAADTKDGGIEIVLKEDGKALVRGAKVTAIASSTITATTAIGPASLTWNVVTDSSTKFLSRAGDAASTTIAVGDIVSFSGIVASTAPLTVKADAVKDWSSLESRTNFSGQVKSIDAPNNRFVFTTKNDGDVIAQLTATTSMANGLNAFFSALSIGDMVRVHGVFNAQTKIVAAQKVTLEGKKNAQGKREGWKGFLRLWENRMSLKLNFNR